MTNPEIALRRMRQQHIGASAQRTPAEIVRWLGAVQAQDYAGAKWAVGLRAGVADGVLEAAISDGSILRLHVLRPTWHFVAAADVRWMLALTAARIKAGMKARLRELEISEPVIARSQDIFRQVLAGGRALTRDALEAALNQGGVSTQIPQRLVHLLMQAELDMVLVNGAQQGKQATYALLDERLPAGQADLPELFDPLAAAAELARRYFTSHGPATLKDFTWWSGLAVGSARAAIAQSGNHLRAETIAGETAWGPAEPVETASHPSGPAGHLLPNYDEYVVAYSNRSAIFDPAHADRLHLRGGVLNNVVILDGLVAGSWKRTIKKQQVLVAIDPLWRFSPAEQQAVEQAAQRYGGFLGQEAVVQYAV